MEKKSVFIGGKQIGANCLKILVERKIIPELVIPNLDDTGIDTWYESLVRVAKENDLPLQEKCHVKDQKIISKIEEIQPEIIFCIGGTQIISPGILAIPPLGCLNIHPAMLPKYRGRFSTAHAIFNGEKSTGVTLHWMDSGIDSGPIISQKEIPITPDDTGKTLYEKFSSCGTDLFRDFLELWLSGKEIPSIPQNENEATYFPKGLPNDGEIDWDWDGEKIRDFIRAMTFEPFPPPTFKLGSKDMVIIENKNIN